VLVFVSAIAAVTTVCLVIQPSRFMSGLTVGVVVTALSAAFLLFFLMTDGNVFTLAGAWAEDFSNDELRKAVKARSVWGAVANIELGGFDIDHLVVAPDGLFAIETKARSGKLDRKKLLDDIAQARRAAKKAESILRSQHVLMPREVQPVLVIWGKRATRDLPAAGRLVDDVPVVPVTHLAEWLITYRTGRLPQDHAEEMLTRLREFKASQVLRDPVLV
jgi:hypothetical protein